MIFDGAHDSRTKRFAAGVVASFQLLALGCIASGDWPVSGFPLDDAWIHALVARTFVEQGTLGIAPGLHGSGATSTLWALILALGHALHVGAPAFALLINAFLLLAAGQVALRMLLADGMVAGSATAAAVAFAIAPNFVWFAASGMEATLFSFLSLWAIQAWNSDRARGKYAAGVALALLSLTRPEGILLLPLLALCRRPRTLGEWSSLTLAPVVVSACHAIFNFARTGHFLPATLGGRRWMWLSPLGGLNALERAAVLVVDWINRLAEFSLGSLDHWWFWLALALAIWGAASALKAPRQRALIAWTLLHVGIYALALPTLGHGGRYQPLLPALFLMLTALGALRLGRSVLGLASARLRSAVFALLALAALALALAGPGTSLLAWRRAQHDAVEHINTTEIGMGRLIARLPPSAVIASFDIGGIGYFSGRPIVELGGLSSDEIVPLLWQGRVSRYLRERRVDYVVLPLGLGGLRAQEPWNFGYRLGLVQSPELELEPVSSLESPLMVWRRGVRATMHCAPRQALYRVHFRGGLR
ncbi:MAG TPA: hypothetical protein VGP93_05185 [Polyangiaceae bacterium]|jgi:hypothetical protein|nr:hypothetical protein [Polyangiaceae bacterium]